MFLTVSHWALGGNNVASAVFRAGVGEGAKESTGGKKLSPPNSRNPDASLFLSSVQFIHSVVSDSLRLCGLEHARPPCPSPTPRVYSNSCPSSWLMPPNHLILSCPLLFLPSSCSQREAVLPTEKISNLLLYISSCQY